MTTGRINQIAFSLAVSVPVGPPRPINREPVVNSTTQSLFMCQDTRVSILRFKPCPHGKKQNVSKQPPPSPYSQRCNCARAGRNVDLLSTSPARSAPFGQEEEANPGRTPSAPGFWFFFFFLLPPPLPTIDSARLSHLQVDEIN